MSSSTRYERRLPELLDELAAPRTPAYFDDILGQVGRTRQRPGWTFLERWLPMSAVSQRLAAAPRVPLRAVVVTALLLIALAVGLALLAGSQRPAVPAPFGPAANGLIAFVDEDGAIRSGAPRRRPSPGSSFRDRAMSARCSRPDGTGSRTSSKDSLALRRHRLSDPMGERRTRSMPRDCSPSPTSVGRRRADSVVVGAMPDKLLAFDAAKPRRADPDHRQGPSLGQRVRPERMGGPRPRPVPRPLGEEIAFLGSGPEGDGLYAMRRDGSGIRPLLTAPRPVLPFVNLQARSGRRTAARSH